MAMAYMQMPVTDTGQPVRRTQVMSFPGQLAPMYICLSAYMYESGVESKVNQLLKLTLT